MMVCKRKTHDYLLVTAVGIMFLAGIIGDDYSVVIEALLLLLFFRKIKFNIYILAFLVTAFVVGMVDVIIGLSETSMLMKQMVGILVSFFFYFSVVNEKNCLEAVRIVKNMSVFVSIISIFQQIAFRLGVHAVYDLRWLVPEQHNFELINYRSYSLYTEPSQLALILMPFTFMALYRLIGKYRCKIRKEINLAESWIIILGFLFTFSSGGFAGLLFGMFLIMKEYRFGLRQILLAGLGTAGLVALFLAVPAFADRINGLFIGIMGNSSGVEIGRTPQAFLDHMMVSLKNLVNTLGMGSGVGSYGTSYFKYVNPLSEAYLINAQDAGSMLFRLLAEVGIGGTALIFVMLGRYYGSTPGIYKIVNMGCLTYLFLKFLRFGHYFGDGLWFIAAMYYYTGKLSKGMESRNEGFNYYDMLQQRFDN